MGPAGTQDYAAAAVQPPPHLGAAERAARNFRNARKIKSNDRSKGHQRIVHFANALGLQEDDDLSSDSGDDTDRDSDGRPADPDGNPALAVQDFQFVTQSDLRQPLTYVHPR